eukprot:jgi/Ulvmu1/10217/UM060_0017.1
MGNCLCCSNSRKRSKHKKLSVINSFTAGPQKSPVLADGIDRNVASSQQNGTMERRNSAWVQDVVNRWLGASGEAASSDQSFISVSVQSELDLEPASAGSTAAFSSCVPSLMPATSQRQAGMAALHSSAVHKLQPGCSTLQKVPAGTTDTSKLPPFSFEQANSANFNLRCKGYSRSKAKAPSQPALYELWDADLYATNSKHWHIMRRIALPPLPKTATGPDGQSLDKINIPPVLVMHLLMPMYPASLFFQAQEGPNVSFIYYFRLPEGFDPATFHTPQALALLQKLAGQTDHPTAANAGARQLIKMIAQVVNPQEWFESGKISRNELRILNSYNAKPVLTRPQQRFYRGENYLEIDLDLHSFSYVARKGMEGFIDRLQPAIWDHGWCLEGRSDGDLPEVLLAGLRGFHWDFTKVMAFPVPALLKHMPEDGTALEGPDGAADAEDVRAALADGALSIDTGVHHPAADEGARVDDMTSQVSAEGISPAGSAQMHTQLVQQRPLSMGSPHGSFVSARSSLTTRASVDLTAKSGRGSSSR